ncbi:MAG: Gfo/Idh/MocA family oxidoreductase [Chloroflexi bacterium]|nr:Gfo/Idh/MocA family oxidoreductase [Chloroflexota bacterium]
MTADLRIGVIGLDTSHVPAFARLLNDSSHPHHVPGGRMVAAYPSYSADIASSAGRVDGFISDVTPLGVAMVDSIAALLEQVDAVLLESVDGRRHLPEARPVIAAGKPLYIDKPLAHNYADAAEIARLAREAGCPLFSASSLRYDANIAALRADPTLGAVLGCDAFSPASLEPNNPGFFWYGVHGVETLYTFMGPGCERVMAHHSPDADLVVGYWADGRLGTVRGTRSGEHGYGATVFGAERIGQVQYSQDVPLYAQLLRQIVPFFQTGAAPVPLDETLEMMALMQAAISSQAEGRAVYLAEVRRQAGA